MSKLFIGIAVIFASLMLINATKFETLAQIDEHPFGNNLLNLVQMNLNMQQVDSASTMQQISDLLQEILASLQQDQADADSVHGQSAQYYDGAISNDNNQIDSFQSLLDGANADLVTLSGQLDDLNSQLSAANTNYDSVTAQIASETEGDQAASAQFAIDQQNLLDAIAACAQAITKLSTLQSSSPVFVQISSQMESTKKALEKQVAKNYPEFIPLLDILSQIKSNANPELVNQAISLITQLKTALEQDLADKQAAEQTRQQNFQTLLASLQEEQSTYSNQITDLNVQIPQVSQQISDKNDAITFYESSLSSAQSQLSSDQAAQANELDNYNQTSAERQSEIDIVNRLIDHFNNQIANVSDFLKGRVQ